MRLLVARILTRLLVQRKSLQERKDLKLQKKRHSIKDKVEARGTRENNEKVLP